MRSILILFAIAALGFAFILQKNDPPEPVSAKAKSSELGGTGRTNMMKLAPEKNRSVAQNAATVRERSGL